jgi:predicted transcriptional regulator
MINMSNVHQLASAIRAGRAALNWSQQDLAKRAGVSLPTIARIESVAANPRFDTVVRLVKTLEQNGVDFDWTAVKKDFAMGVLLNASGLSNARHTSLQSHASKPNTAP